VDVDAQHRTLVVFVKAAPGNTVDSTALSLRWTNAENDEEATMGRGILLWLLGVPIPIIILLWLFFGH
jgi:hypothetical protein